ncbi:hypothetical protein [Yersinia enterocolitica]|uniref:hypothetical protein n=1 Tax=Yersinia enterocolitica TaxID=630 RepID=UPI0005E2C6C8|nr:hypothetical protein [Yersinia enterocolitica]EKN3611922.1 hypothetical protein [Yersinia enterocolitica]EKN4111994.1 hypothetical protein [Yersinia enterocolitica]EKN4790449.1 hypothetical protein [Yersinia enterocolitica]EKN5071703.1 hypothetical protein [Yersinia enterocolitica]EKN5930282.1 hypothetical protein [Yersinia enterocolitica]
MKSKVINGFLRFIFDMIGVIVTFIMAIGFMIAYAFYEGIAAWGVAIGVFVVGAVIFWVVQKCSDKFTVTKQK